MSRQQARVFFLKLLILAVLVIALLIVIHDLSRALREIDESAAVSAMAESAPLRDESGRLLPTPTPEPTAEPTPTPAPTPIPTPLPEFQPVPSASEQITGTAIRIGDAAENAESYLADEAHAIEQRGDDQNHAIVRSLSLTVNKAEAEVPTVTDFKISQTIK